MDKDLGKQKIAEITEKIVKNFKPEKIILFGSWAWETPGPDSDVDLLIVQESLKPRIEREQEIRSVLFPAGIPVDILVYTPSELQESVEKNKNLFLKDILNNGIILYANDKVRERLAATRG